MVWHEYEASGLFTQSLRQRCQIRAVDQWGLMCVEIRIVVAEFAGVPFVTRQGHKLSRLMGCGELGEQAIPVLLQFGEATEVIEDGVVVSRDIRRHVRPEGVPSDGDEIEMLSGIVQHALGDAVAITDGTMVVDVTPECLRERMLRKKYDCLSLDGLEKWVQGRIKGKRRGCPGSRGGWFLASPYIRALS